MSELDSDVPFEALEETFGEVIDEPKVADAATELTRLKMVSAKKAWIDAGRYRDAEEALNKKHRSDAETNDHACALAWLALTERRLDYWDEAVKELDELKDRVENLQQQGEQAQRQARTDLERVEFNLARIHAAREAVGA
jgi:tetratricopeptide (TPR) repeat protein